MWSNRARKPVLLAGLAGLALSLTACETVRNVVGGDKSPPDEFAVVSKAPLIIPPDYNLKPPKPGAPPLNQVSPTESAQAALYNSDPKTAASAITGSYSEGEKMLLAQSGAATASDSIRQQITADNRGLDSADESFTDRLLFSSNNTSEAPLDADTEKARIDAGKNAPPAPQGQDHKKDSGGWLDGIF
ncbi:MAG: DUF3035 domain-containing protein [Alphaproteobacteria bacterium]|nr:DUF3035 domain-containing protein [Alphaproteobacteria bacterium]